MTERATEHGRRADSPASGPARSRQLVSREDRRWRADGWRRIFPEARHDPHLDPLAAALARPLDPVGRIVTAPDDQPRRALMRHPERSCFDLHQSLRRRLGEGGRAVQPSPAGRPATKAGDAASVSSSGPASAATRAQAVPPTTRAPMPAKTRVQGSPVPPDLVVGGLARVFSSSRSSQRPWTAATRTILAIAETSAFAGGV